MKHQPHVLVSVALLACTALYAGCLPDDPPVKGRLLQAGSNIEDVHFMRFAPDSTDWWLIYNLRRQRAGETSGGVIDTWVVNYTDPSKRREIISGRSDRAEWGPVDDASGARFYMTNERLSHTGLPVGTLNRVSLTEGPREAIEDVMSYALGSDRITFYYRKYVPGDAAPELHLRDLAGRDRNLGPLSGQVLLLGNDLLYFITGKDQVLTRVRGFDGVAEPLRSRVSRFQLAGGEKAIITVVEKGALKTFVIDFSSKNELPLPVDNPCCWLGLSNNVFQFAASVSAEAPGRLYEMNIVTGASTFIDLPPQLANVVSFMPRPKHPGEALAFDSDQRIAVYRPNGDPMFTPLRLRPSAPTFSLDGKYLLFLVREPPPPPPAVSSFPTGHLWVQSADDWSAPPRRLSPEGASVPVEPKGFLVREGKPFPLVFWARYGLGASNLYLGDWEASEPPLQVASGIGAVQVSHTQVLGIINMSQDLTGELVYRDFITGKQKTIERGVSAVEFRDDRVAFVVRERMGTSHRNGLWASTLPSLDDEMPTQKRVEAPGIAD